MKYKTNISWKGYTYSNTNPSAIPFIIFDVAYDFLHMQNKFGIQIPQGLQKSWYLEKRFIIVLHGLDFSYETKNVS